MSGNVIPLLMSQQFSALGLLNLQRISMSKCGLVQIDGHAFGGLNNLVELDLSQNQLKEVRRGPNPEVTCCTLWDLFEPHWG